MSNNETPHGINTDPQKGLTEEQIVGFNQAFFALPASDQPSFQIKYNSDSAGEVLHHMTAGSFEVVYAPEPPKEYEFIFGTDEKPLYTSKVTIEGYAATPDGRPVIILRDVNTGSIIRITLNEEATDE